jgi:NAD(P)-dependent dehydrogenase (short-subunit alcohol dehydrogenase family)
MTAKFGATSTTDDVLAGLDLKGKRVLVTGTSSGLGIETARALVAHGAYVVGTARDLDKAYAATGAVRAAAATSGGFELIEVDLGSLASVRTCTDTLLLQAEPFDVDAYASIFFVDDALTGGVDCYAGGAGAWHLESPR